MFKSRCQRLRMLFRNVTRSVQKANGAALSPGARIYTESVMIYAHRLEHDANEYGATMVWSLAHRAADALDQYLRGETVDFMTVLDETTADLADMDD